MLKQRHCCLHAQSKAKRKLHNHNLISSQGDRVESSRIMLYLLSPFQLFPLVSRSREREEIRTARRQRIKWNVVRIFNIAISSSSLSFGGFASLLASVYFHIIVRAIILQSVFLCFLFVRAVNDSKWPFVKVFKQTEEEFAIGVEESSTLPSFSSLILSVAGFSIVWWQ